LAQRSRPKTSDDVRRAFLDFFKSKQHLERPSSSLVPSQDDPTVLLTTAGMQPLIPYMLGRAQPPAPRMVSVQKCFRTTDIDAVGNPRNLTFFEMLGNFSIGDYFKPEAVSWAWELVTEWLRISPERVWITVHPSDDEARQLWLEIGIPSQRIGALEDNWWGPPGAEGPCGPDSELYFDRGEALGCGRPTCAPGCDCDRYLEFWNLVFMQFFQDRQGNRTALPRPNIDTGMGLERTTAIVQDVPSVYETDLFRPISDAVAALAGASYGRDQRTDYALRVLADHGRAMTFLAADGVAPSNEGRGYVMRRVIRRAVRYGQKNLGIERPFTRQLAGCVIDRMAGHYPELTAQHEAIYGLVETEEKRFRETLAAGESRLSEWISEAEQSGIKQIAGERLFVLHDTYGFPFDLSAESLADHGLEADRAGFDRAMSEQQARSRRREAAGHVVGSAGLEAAPPSEFVGHEQLAVPAEILAVQGDSGSLTELVEGQGGVLVLDRTPFYPEGGGQVGDRGHIHLEGDGLFQVQDTQQDPAGRILHHGKVLAGRIQAGAQVRAEVDRPQRKETARHHTLTHLLHQSLRDVLGPGTQQRGSLVAPGVARFDFNYQAPLSEAQRHEIQERINAGVLANLDVTWQVVPLEVARHSGALMIFGEKYGDEVRVVSIGDLSRELCGGTHVHQSSDVGTAVILRETGIGSGLRRVEVVAGQTGLEHVERRLQDVHEIARRLNVPVDDARRRVDELLGQLDEARREIERLSARLAARRADELAGRVQQIDGVNVVATRLEDSLAHSLAEQWDAIRVKIKSGVVFLGAAGADKTSLLVGVTEDLSARGLQANQLMPVFAALAGGKGGGNARLARGSGSAPELLGPALEAAPRLVAEALQR
jgi:alanyl-tRNA synthetase